MNMIFLFREYLGVAAKRLLVYREYLFSELIGNLVIPVSLNLLLWNALLRENNVNYTFLGITKYIIISNLIFMFTQIHMENLLCADIKTYRLGQKLLHPVRYLTETCLRHFAESVAKFGFVYLPLIALMLILTRAPVGVNIPLAILTVLLGYGLSMLFSFIIGVLSFWLTEIWGVAAFNNLLTGLLAGAVIPLDVFSPGIQRALFMLPFPYMAYVPTKLICDGDLDMTLLKSTLPMAFAWLAIFIASAALLWKAGLRKYTSAGA